MVKLGFVGLGVMGGRMVKRLLDAGHTVTGYNRTKSKADWLVEAGMRWADSPRAVAEAADVTFSMVTNTKALLAVTGGPDGILAGLGAGKVYVDMSTVSPAVSQDLAVQVAQTGAHMIDAPVSGSVETLETGRLGQVLRPGHLLGMLVHGLTAQAILDDALVQTFLGSVQVRMGFGDQLIVGQ